MILSSLQDANILVGIIISIGTFIIGTLIPIFVNIAKNHSVKKKLQDKRNATIDSLPEKLDQIEQKQAERFDQLDRRQNEMEENLQAQIQDIKEEQAEDRARFESFEIQNLKYQINDAYLSANNIHDVPYETLIVASEACDIYKGKGLNHEIGARCDMIYEEIERRERLRAEGKNEY